MVAVWGALLLLLVGLMILARRIVRLERALARAHAHIDATRWPYGPWRPGSLIGPGVEIHGTVASSPDGVAEEWSVVDARSGMIVLGIHPSLEAAIRTAEVFYDLPVRLDDLKDEERER